MGLKLTASDIITEALRVIGEVSPADPSPDDEVMEIGFRWLSITMSTTAGMME